MQYQGFSRGFLMTFLNHEIAIFFSEVHRRRNRAWFRQDGNRQRRHRDVQRLIDARRSICVAQWLQFS